MQTYVLIDQAVTASADYGPLILNDSESIYVQVVAGAGVTGTLTLQYSADNISWFSDATTMTVNGVTVDGQAYYPSSQFVRFSYSHTGTPGNLRLVVNVKNYSL